MATVAHDRRPSDAPAPASRFGSGLGFALASAASFGLAGTLARGLIDAGWSPGAAVTIRIAVAAAVLLVPALIALRGRWQLLRANAGLVVGYGVIAVAGCQFAYFNAVAHMDVAVALLIEYTAPVAVMTWLWLRHGQRPGRRTVGGAVIAAAGLTLVLEVFAGTRISGVGTTWAMVAMVCLATYFVLSADEDNGLPPLVLAGGGLVVATVLLGAAGLIGVIPFEAGASQVEYAGWMVPWWVPCLALGVGAGAIAYTTGIAASRRLGSRLASFVALIEVLAALLLAWALLGQMPGLLQLAGGALIVAGVVIVKLGERS